MPDRIEGDGGVILISHPALLEVLEVIRKGITESKPYTDLDNGKNKAIKDKVQEKASLFLKALFRLTRGHRVVLVESQKPVDRWYKMTYSPFVSSSGDISTITIISATGGALPGYRYRGAGHHEVQRAYRTRILRRSSAYI